MSAPEAQAVLFDMDGTLYRLKPVRRKILFRLARLSFQRPIAGWLTLRMIRAYRRAHESLRDRELIQDLAECQIREAAVATGLDRTVVEAVIEQWMEREPLDLLSEAAAPHVHEFVAALRDRGISTGVVSDYPPHAKLAALGLQGCFDVVVAAQDRAVQQLKPNPAGLLFALRQLGVEPARAVYIGDRPDVDGEAAGRAGMRFIHIGARDSYRDISSKLGITLPAAT